MKIFCLVHAECGEPEFLEGETLDEALAKAAAIVVYYAGDCDSLTTFIKEGRLERKAGNPSMGKWLQEPHKEYPRPADVNGVVVLTPLTPDAKTEGGGTPDSFYAYEVTPGERADFVEDGAGGWERKAKEVPSEHVQ